MEQLQPAILNFMYEESLRGHERTVSLESMSDKYGIDLGILQQHALFLQSESIAKRQMTPYGPKRILFDVSRKNNDPRNPKGSENLYTVDPEKLKKLIERVRSS